MSSSQAAKRSKAIPPSQQTTFGELKVALFLVPSLTALFLSTYFYSLNHSKFACFKLPNLSTPSHRLAYTAKLTFFPAATLLLAIKWVWLHRVWYPMTRNPLSGHEYLLEKASRILQNTVEQVLLFVLNIFVFSQVAPEKTLIFLPWVVAVFTLGRVAFLIGYTIHPMYRIPGFVWTMVPSLVLFGYNLKQICC